MLPHDLYGGTYRLIDKVLTNWGLSYTMVDQTDPDALDRGDHRRDAADLGRDPHQPAARRRRHQAVVAAKRHALVAVDNTFATPANQNPLAHGRRLRRALDDQVPGRALRRGRRRRRHRRPGAVRAAALRPELGRRRSRPVRLLPRAPRAAHPAPADGGPRRSAAAVVESQPIPEASDVRWPGFSGMVSFRHPRAEEIVTRTKLFTLAESLGGVESLIEVPRR